MFVVFLVLITLTLGVEKKARQWCAHIAITKENYNVDELFLCITKLALANEGDQHIYFQGIPESGSEPEQRGGCAF
uniref:Uncharacterized protein n=1 Tax=Brassica campestris TaxID=3711 RepID=M4E4R9_BRACM